MHNGRLLMILLLALPGVAAAQAFRCVDADTGQVLYTDQPCQGGALVVPERSEEQRRADAVAAVRAIADLEFVNGGGTGSVESTAADDSVTEIAAGSGLFAGHYFDDYAAFSQLPAAAFALSVVRRPRPDCVTVLGGGWVASGPPGLDRIPQVMHPTGLKMVPREMAGEVQTPLVGRSARALAVGDRVWLRHAKSGELSERVNEFLLVDGDRVIDRQPTYRGEGKAFL